MTEHPLSFHCNLPCATDAFDFQAEVNFTCSVLAPQDIVQRNVTDVRQVLKPLLVKVMRFISCNYDISQRKAAEHEISVSLEKAVSYPCFQLNHFTLTLSLPETVKQIKQQIERKTGDIEATIIIEEKERRLEEQRQDFSRLIMKRKMDFYGEILNEGNWRLLALQLAQRPSDVEVIESKSCSTRPTWEDNITTTATLTTCLT